VEDDIEPLDYDFGAMDDSLQDLKAVVDHAREDLAEIGPPGNFALPETVSAEPDTSWWDKATDFVFDKFLPEVGEMIEQRFHEGQNEVAKALFGQSDGFVLYGHQSLEPVEPQSYEDALREAAQREPPEQDLKMGM
jgi:hypothetical protein